MLFSEKLKQEINQDYQEALTYFGDYTESILSQLAKSEGDESYCMKFIYANLPLTDVADCSFDTLYGFVTHSLFIREHMPWGKEIPVDIFLGDVLYPRINTEKLENCRPILYEMTHDRILGKSMYEAVLEVNYWCLEQATYQTTDIRTSSPLTVIKRAYGRCGEESTFTVSTLRSLGIPARQIYTPKWAHCDDNHAWTEGWCDGTWHYLGACEPEAVLDRGWFTSASARAMLLHSRTFYKHIESDFKIANEGPISTLNRIQDYTESTKTKIKVIKEGIPVNGAKIIFEIINYSEMAPLSFVYSDSDGMAELVSGLGSLNIHVVLDGYFKEQLIHTKDTELVLIDLTDGIKKETGFQEFNTVAPIDTDKFSVPLSPDLLKQHKERFAACTKTRKMREERFLILSPTITNSEIANNQEEIKDVLFMAKGNGKEVLRFLNENGSSALHLLRSLNEKDYTDLNPEILLSHIKHSLPFQTQMNEEIFNQYVRCPRVYFENITDFRPFICNFFSTEDRERFLKKPSLIWDYIIQSITFLPQKEYGSIYTSPEGVLRLKKASPMSQNILFVAICRTFGIPARLNPESLQIEYYEHGSFVSPITNELLKATLKIQADPNENWVYCTNWSLAIIENGEYQTLKLNCKPWEVENIFLKSGFYRIITANRLPNGNIYGNKYCFEVTNEEMTTIQIALREFEPADLLIHLQLNDFKLHHSPHTEVCASSLLTKKHNLLLWLEENEEPTEHILNELAENEELFLKLDCSISFILRKDSCLQNANICRVLTLLPHIQVFYDYEFEMQEPIARSLYIDPGKLPLAAVIQEDLTAIYAISGYHVGLADLLSKIVQHE